MFSVSVQQRPQPSTIHHPSHHHHHITIAMAPTHAETCACAASCPSHSSISAIRDPSRGLGALGGALRPSGALARSLARSLSRSPGHPASSQALTRTHCSTAPPYLDSLLTRQPLNTKSSARTTEGHCNIACPVRVTAAAGGASRQPLSHIHTSTNQPPARVLSLQLHAPAITRELKASPFA
jgi:hypothetical protein